MTQLIQTFNTLTQTSYYGDGAQIYPVGSENHVIGLCTGLLASAAVASSRSVGELIPVAVEAVVVALRLGLCAYKVRDYVGQYSGETQSWSAVISGVNEEKALAIIEQFSVEKVRSVPIMFVEILLLINIGTSAIL